MTKLLGPLVLLAIVVLCAWWAVLHDKERDE